MAASSKALKECISDDEVWHAHFKAAYPKLAGLLDGSCAWFKDSTWRRRCGNLQQRKTFPAQVLPHFLSPNQFICSSVPLQLSVQPWQYEQKPFELSCQGVAALGDCAAEERFSLLLGSLLAAQVYNRELENDMEDFMLSAYDATCELESGPSGPPTFTVRYLPMGRGKSRTVIETGVALERLRLAPPNSTPHDVLKCAPPLCCVLVSAPAHVSCVCLSMPPNLMKW